MELKLKATNMARIESQVNSAVVSSALLAALENSRPSRFIPQEVLLRVSKPWGILYKSLLSLTSPPPTFLGWKAHEHGVPTGFFRLPLEIREQIYGFLVGYKAVLKIPENYHKSRPSRRSTHNGPTGLLQTCRQLYVEASTSIYTQNTFHFANHNDFLAFSHAVNPILLSQIKSLSFDLNSILRVDGTPYDHQCPRFTVNWIDGVEALWSHVWSIIAAMDNLTDVKVFLQNPGFPEWEGIECLCLPEREILAPLFKVNRDLKVFDMNVPWIDSSSWTSLRTSQPVVQDASFNLIRRGTNPLQRSKS